MLSTLLSREKRKRITSSFFSFFFSELLDETFFIALYPSVFKNGSISSLLFVSTNIPSLKREREREKCVKRSSSSIPRLLSFIRRIRMAGEISYRSELQSWWKRWLAIKIGSAYLSVHAVAAHLLHPSISPLYSRPFIERRSITVLPRTIPFGTVRISFFRFVPRVERGDKSSANRVRCFSRAFLSLSLPPILFRSRLPSRPKSRVNLHRDRIYRETCSNAVLFFQRDPFSLFRPLCGYYAVIYRNLSYG